MENINVNKLYKLLSRIPVTDENKKDIDLIRDAIDKSDFATALTKLKSLNSTPGTIAPKNAGNALEFSIKFDGSEEQFPDELKDISLEYTYLGLLFNNPKSISRYYFSKQEAYFSCNDLTNLYKEIIFTEAEAYAPESIKNDFSIYKDYNITLKNELKQTFSDKNYSMENTYLELKKLFVLRKNYLILPEKAMQDKLLEITHYKLYNQMSTEEVESAINQIVVTNKFKQAVLNEGLTDFLLKGENNLTTGISLPFPILSSVFKGLRKGETMAFAMPSNAGKSRFTVNLATYMAFVHKKKVLVISNEMSEEKMRLCLITTVLNNPEIQKLHGQKLHKSEGEILEFKFKPNKDVDVELDENGFVLQHEGESRADFSNRLKKVSDEFISVCKATDWLNKELDNCLYFINVTDHTNDELNKIIMNYYYKEKIEYIFYDTLKTDTANIGNALEIKRTTTILANLAQNYGMYIGSTLQLKETSTLPINLDINDLSVSSTVKEVLDTLCLFKQIYKPAYKDYEYSLNEVDTKFYDLENFSDPDVRYYACVVDKNRAGAKPKLLFRLNLAYNSWEELGYLRLKTDSEEKATK